MASRRNQPSHIDLAARPIPASQQGAPSPRDLPSPRSGEVAPTLSPLDALRHQGWLLAQRLESGDNGRRMSRLPPLTVNDALHSRSGYFGSTPSSATTTATEKGPSPTSAGPEGTGNNVQVSQPQARPQSHYPTIAAFDDAESIISRDSHAPSIKTVPEEEEEEDQEDAAQAASRDTPPALPDLQSESPETIPIDQTLVQDLPWPGVKKQSTNDSMESAASSTLAPPSSPARSRSPRFLRDRPSIRPVRGDSGDDNTDALSVNTDRHQLNRHPSSGSGYSRPISPFSPVFAPPRSPSISSEHSQHPRTSVNFSRPLSRSGRPSFETNRSFDSSGRSLRVDSPPLRPSLDVLSLSDSITDSPQLPNAPWIGIDPGTPLSMTDDESSPWPGNKPDTDVPTKYTLPRGRSVSKSSIPHHSAYREGEQQHPRHRPNGLSQENAKPNQTHQTRSSRDDDRQYAYMNSSVPDLTLGLANSANDSISTNQTIKGHRSNPSFPPASGSVISESSSTYTIRPGHLTNRSISGLGSKPSHASPLASDAQSVTANTPSNMPDPHLLADSLSQLTPEGHLAKGLACHENNELQKSTYHLRLAAKGGEPTGMLMYALACRHGWGMRPNQAEGVTWLRKAVDSSGLVVAEDECPSLGEIPLDDSRRRGSAIIAAKRHKAQLALAVYELGQSYMNGWGIKVDKAAALRCYELAGTFEDGDALVEAGSCYAKGWGCKKDLKKAAEFYRRAEKKGMNLTGQSW